MRTGLYSMAELFGNRHIEQFVVPEIQRDYVWGEEQVQHLLRSILDNFRAWRQEQVSPTLKVVRRDSDASPGGGGEIQSLQTGFAEFHARRIHSTNVGFIYAYSDNDLPGQCFLIDGQQRITTIYLALLATASRNDDLKERFRARYCLCSNTSDDTVVPTRLDYRLREHTTQFLHQWVWYLLLDDAGRPVKDQSWYLRRLDGDTTVQNLLGNYKTIETLVEEALSEDELTKLYDYLEDLVECWYFDTNESEQGEELYIYLNARGESIADNENIKARLLATLDYAEEKEKWGRMWEEWQDYFWQKRKVGVSVKEDNPNADRGFNSFLSCIEHLEKLRCRGEGLAATVDLATIQKYIDILHWLEKHKGQFKTPYAYADWVDDWFSKVWGIFNQAETMEWSANLRDSNKSQAHNRMVLVWGTLLCVLRSLEKASGNWKGLDCSQIFRAIRVHYLRFHNFGRAVASLEECINALLEDTASAFSNLTGTNPEERCKWNYLFDKPEHERLRLEGIIWHIEDHPLNLNGRDLEALNLTHLIDLNKEVTHEQLVRVRDAFYKILPQGDDPSSATRKKVASVLLYYGSYWNRVSPWYLENYDLGDWRRTIRGKGSEEKSGGSLHVFREFFEEFLQAKVSFDDFASEKREAEQVDPETEKDLRNALIWYSKKLGTRFFEKGMHIEIETNETVYDVYFPQLLTIWNTRGNFRAKSGYARMSDQLRNKV